MVADNAHKGTSMAIMQPYLFPYVGYYQLIQSVDRFVIYDDVNFIKQGWINRNNILVNGVPYRFTVPLLGLSSNTLIKDVEVDEHLFPRWRDKFMKTLMQSYAKAPHYRWTLDLVDAVIEPGSTHIATLASRSLTLVMEALGMATVVIPSSTRYNNSQMKAQSRVLDICAREGASRYTNAQGGKELYDHGIFLQHGIHLSFIEPKLRAYAQSRAPFTPGLSIIDVLMFNPLDEVRDMLKEFKLN